MAAPTLLPTTATVLKSETEPLDSWCVSRCKLGSDSLLYLGKIASFQLMNIGSDKGNWLDTVST
jgi:hypothetical protein